MLSFVAAREFWGWHNQRRERESAGRSAADVNIFWQPTSKRGWLNERLWPAPCNRNGMESIHFPPVRHSVAIGSDAGLPINHRCPSSGRSHRSNSIANNLHSVKDPKNARLVAFLWTPPAFLSHPLFTAGYKAFFFPDVLYAVYLHVRHTLELIYMFLYMSSPFDDRVVVHNFSSFVHLW